MNIAKKLIKKTEQDDSNLWKAILDRRNTPTKEEVSGPTQRFMPRRTKTLLYITKKLLFISYVICIRDLYSINSEAL